MDPLSADFLKLARGLRSAELYDKAYEVYLATVTRNPALVEPLQAEFRDIIDQYNNDLAQRGRVSDIFSNFENAMKIYPNCHNLLTDLGKYLFKYAFYKQACNHFERALYINPHHSLAEKNLNSVKNLLVERWHFRMLNDNLRNDLYRLAIEESLDPENDKVLDVGTGTGILAIYAYEHGAKDIVACDGSETMTDLAKAILEKHGIANDIKILNKMSTSMDSQDLNGKATLLVTEMFDAGLFGEHVLSMLQHAWYNLLDEEAEVIPNMAEFFVAAAQCDHLNMKYQLSPKAKKLLNLENKNIHILAPDETYDCEDLNHQKDIKYLTEAKTVLDVDFNDLHDIEMHLYNTEPYKVKLKATGDGVINTIVGWFNIYLTDTITLTTDPRSEQKANAWQQAVFYDQLPRTVKTGDSFDLQFLMNEGRMSLMQGKSKITRVSPKVIRFLNDEDYMKTIVSGIPTACIYLNQIEEMSQISIADLCPFPVFGMLMMKRGAASLLCCANNRNDKKFIIEVFKSNNIPITNVTILVGNDWAVNDLGDEKYHAIFAHFLELGGDIDIRLKDIAMKLKERRLHADGLFMPANMWVVGQLVSSHWLETNNMLNSVNVGGINMEDDVNSFAVSTNFFVDFSTLNYVPITDPVQICVFSNSTEVEWITTLVTKDGFPNAILCSYMIEPMQGLEIISTNRPNTFMDGMLFLIDKPTECLKTGTSVCLCQVKDEEGGIKLTMR